MSSRNRGNIRRFPEKAGKNDLLKQAVNNIADDIAKSFNEMISAKLDALNWAIDQLPKMLEEAGLPALQFQITDGLLPFLLAGFADSSETMMSLDDEEDDNEEEEGNDFQGMYPCFSASDNLPAGVEQIDLMLVVNGDEETDEEGAHRIDAFLIRVGTDETLRIFDGEDWVDMEEMLEYEEDDEDDDFLF